MSFLQTFKLSNKKSSDFLPAIPQRAKKDSPPTDLPPPHALWPRNFPSLEGFRHVPLNGWVARNRTRRSFHPRRVRRFIAGVFDSWGVCICIPWNRKMDIKVIKLKGNLHFFGFMSSLGGRVHLFLKHQYCRKMPCGGWNRMEWWNSFEHLGYFQASCSRSTFGLYDELLPIKSDENNMRSWGSDKTWQNLIHS